MVIVYSSCIGPFKYLIGETKTEVSQFKNFFPKETIVVSPLLSTDKFVWVLEDSLLKFDFRRNDTIEELSSVLKLVFKESHCPKMDIYNLEKLLKHVNLKALRAKNEQYRVDLIQNSDTDSGIWKTRQIAMFGYNVDGSAFLTPISGSGFKQSSPLQPYSSKLLTKPNEKELVLLSTTAPFEYCTKREGSNFDFKMTSRNVCSKTLLLDSDKVEKIKSQRAPILHSSVENLRRKLNNTGDSIGMTAQKLKDFPVHDTIDVKKKRICFSGPKVVENVTNVLKVFKGKDVNDSPFNLNPVQLTAKLTGVSQSTIYRNKETLRSQKKKVKMTKKAREQRAAETVTKPDKIRLRKQLDRWWKEETEVSVKKVAEWLSNEAGLHFGEYKVRQVLRGMGLTFKKKNRNSIIEERGDLVRWRFRFLCKKLELKRSTVPILYCFQDETWLYAGMVSRNGWQFKNGTRYDIAACCGFGTGVSGPVKGRDKGVRAIVLSIITQFGILENSTRIVISGLPETQQKEDYHHEMDSAAFMQYMRSSVRQISELGKKNGMKAVLFIDNASYHSKIRSQAPTSQTKKADVLKFLTTHAANVDEPFNKDMHRPQLFQISKRFVEKNGGVFAFRIYELDAWAAEEYDVEIVRLPPYHSHFNPIELMWQQLKSHLKSSGKTTDKVAEVRTRALQFLNSFDATKCCNLIKHVETIEQQHRSLLGIR